MSTPEERHSPWDWPSEWVRDEKFWREVATRTLAGVVTLISLGTPVVLYAMFAGALTAEQAVPILIGAGLVLLIITAYVFGIRLSRSARLRNFIASSIAWTRGTIRSEGENLDSRVLSFINIAIPLFAVATAIALSVLGITIMDEIMGIDGRTIQEYQRDQGIAEP